MRDALFIKIIYVLVGMIAAYGLGVGVVLLFTGAESDVVIRYINSFGAIFTGILGLCSGYLIGAKNGD